MISSAKESAQERVSSAEVLRLLAEFHSFVPGARVEAVSALKALDRGAVVEELGRLLESPDPELRCDAAEALLRIDAHQTIELVLPLLADPTSTTRWHTCGLLHDFGDRRAIAMLVQVLLNDPDADVRLAAAYALGEVGDGSVLPTLLHTVQWDDGTDYEGRRVRDGATEAIESIRARES